MVSVTWNLNPHPLKTEGAAPRRQIECGWGDTIAGVAGDPRVEKIGVRGGGGIAELVGEEMSCKAADVAFCVACWTAGRVRRVRRKVH